MKKKGKHIQENPEILKYRFLGMLHHFLTPDQTYSMTYSKSEDIVNMFENSVSCYKSFVKG